MILRYGGSNVEKLIIPKSLNEFGIYQISNQKLKFIDTTTNSNPNFKVVKKDGVTISTEKDAGDKMLLDQNNKLLCYFATAESKITIPSTITEACERCLQNCQSISELELNCKKVDRLLLDDATVGTKRNYTIVIGSGVKVLDALFNYGSYGYKINIKDNDQFYFENGILYEKTSKNEYIVKRLIALSNDNGVTIPEKVNNLNVTGIGDNAFAYRSKLSKINIPINIKSIGNWAFRGDPDLTDVTILNKELTLGVDCFYICPNLNNIYMPTTQANNKISGAPWGATKGERVIKWASQ